MKTTIELQVAEEIKMLKDMIVVQKDYIEICIELGAHTHEEINVERDELAGYEAQLAAYY